LSKLFVDEIQPKTTGGVINAKGMILQVKQGILTTTFSGNTSNTAFEDTPLNVSITPQSTNSKILLTGMINFSGGVSQQIFLKVVRNGTDFLLSTESMGNRTKFHFAWFFSGSSIQFLVPAHINLLDTPSTTSTLTYTVQVATPVSSVHQAFLNRMGTDSNASNYGYTVSTLTAMEIGG